MKTLDIETTQEQFETDVELIGATLHLRRASRRVIRAKEDLEKEIAASKLTAAVTGVPDRLLRAFFPSIIDAEERVRVAEENELEAEQLWEDASEDFI